MIEGPGHVPFDQIEMNVKKEMELCHEAPFYVLGPLVTDIAPGYDHITSCHRRHDGRHGRRRDALLRHAEGAPRPARTRTTSSRASSPTRSRPTPPTSRGKRPGARDRDDALSRARYAFDWKEQFRLSLDPETAQAMHDATLPEEYFKIGRVLLDVRPEVLLDAHQPRRRGVQREARRGPEARAAEPRSLRGLSARRRCASVAPLAPLGWAARGGRHAGEASSRVTCGGARRPARPDGAAARRGDAGRCAEDPRIAELWARAKDGDADDLARLADREGTTVSTEALADPPPADGPARRSASRTTSRRSPLAGGRGHERDGRGGGRRAGERATLASEPRRAMDPEDALEIREGCAAPARAGEGPTRAAPRRSLRRPGAPHARRPRVGRARPTSRRTSTPADARSARAVECRAVSDPMSSRRASAYANETYLQQLLSKAVAAKASDVHLKVGQPPGARVRGDIIYFAQSR